MRLAEDSATYLQSSIIQARFESQNQAFSEYYDVKQFLLNIYNYIVFVIK